MTQRRGGLRSRLIADSFRVLVLSQLVELGWFGTRQHLPLTYTAKPSDWDSPVALNSFAITPEHVADGQGGVGNQPANRHHMYVDFWAENDAVGTSFAYDVRDILTGKMVTHPYLECEVWDLELDPPEVFTFVDIESVRVDRATGFPRDWQRHWYVVSCWLVDDYLDESPTASFSDTWTSDLNAAWMMTWGLN